MMTLGLFTRVNSQVCVRCNRFVFSRLKDNLGCGAIGINAAIRINIVLLQRPCICRCVSRGKFVQAIHVDW